MAVSPGPSRVKVPRGINSSNTHNCLPTHAALTAYQLDSDKNETSHPKRAWHTLPNWSLVANGQPPSMLSEKKNRGQNKKGALPEEVDGWH